MAAGSTKRTLVEVLAHHAVERGDAPAFTALSYSSTPEQRLTFGELASRARCIASELRRRGLVGEPVLLLVPAGLDYVCSLLGCLWSGAIAVPAYPPQRTSLSRAVPRIESIVRDAGVTHAIAPMDVHATLRKSDALAGLELILPAGDASPDSAVPPTPSPDEPALLQYTSGSTGDPRGVVVSHRQLLHNERMIEAAAGWACDGNWVTWLPPYHDMGLIGAILHPIYLGQHCALMAPEAFMRRPRRWLEAITRFGAVTTVAPNFAFDVCVRRIAPEAREGLDLSTLRVVWNGAEPIDAGTLDRFVEAFAPSGFRRQAFYPCYGMAEATLVISGGAVGGSPVLREVAAAELERGAVVSPASSAPSAPGQTVPARPRSRRLVGCGRALLDERVLIVDPGTTSPLRPDRVGEIWVQGAAVASGYWNRPIETEQTFGAHTAGGDGPFLRTGDLGFLDREGELFVTGRLKDLIIVRGLNHYPHDIERTVQRIDAALVDDGGAVFSIDVDGEERLVIVQELDKRVGPDADALLAAIPPAVRMEHDLAVHEVVLIKRGSLGKTSSGKVQRRATREAYLDGRLEVVARSSIGAPERAKEPPDMPPSPRAVPEVDPRETQERPRAVARPTTLLPPPPSLVPVTRAADPPEAARRMQPLRPAAAQQQRRIARYLCRRLAERLQTTPEHVPLRAPLANLGIDSLAAAELTEELEQWLGVELDTTLVYDHPSVETLSQELAHRVSGRDEPWASARPDNAQERSCTPSEPVAIVGMACRVPGAPDLSRFWELLRNGVHAITEVPADRWDADALYDPDPRARGKSRSKWGGFVDGIDRFDAEFFGISASEARAMDPQQRMFLEAAWHALEDAGISPGSLAGSATGVFAGVCTSDYATLYGGALDLIDADYGTGSSPGVVAGRVSYLLDLRGPSKVVDSACSSSLVALHDAAEGLQRGACDLAIAGGVNAVLAPEASVYFSRLGTLSSDDRVKAFDAEADGFVRGEGVGAVVLKRLGDAIADGDHIYALLCGAAVNHDGRSNGMTAPSGAAQRQVIERALTAAGIDAADLGYVEAHGVGTPVADAVELRSLGALLEAHGRDAREPLLVGSAKTNVGHLEAAAGVIGVIKTALALHHGELPPHLHLQNPHPDIGLDALPIQVPTVLTPWARGERPRFAGVSGFGFGGTNAHLVLREAPEPRAKTTRDERPLHVLTLSARSPAALAALAGRHSAALEDAPLADAAFTTNAGRDHFTHRLAVVAPSSRAVQDALDRFSRGETAPELRHGVRAERGPSVALVFGPEVPPPGALSTLCAHHPQGRELIAQCDQYLGDTLERPLSTLLGDTHAVQLELLSRPSHGHPALVAFQCLQGHLLGAWGASAEIVLGQGAGEIAAAVHAGVMSLEDGLRLSGHLGRVLESLRPGALVSATIASYRRELAQVDFRLPTIPMVSGSRGRALEVDEVPDARHWSDHLYHEARAMDGMDALGEEEAELVVCLGEHSVAIPGATPLQTGYDWASLLEVVSALYCAGVELDWQAFDAPYERTRRSLPTYPFERKRYWMDFPERDLDPAPVVRERPSSHPLISRIRTVSRSGFVRRDAPKAQGEDES